MLFAEVQFARVDLSTRDLGNISRGTAYASLEVTQEESSTTCYTPVCLSQAYQRTKHDMAELMGKVYV